MIMNRSVIVASSRVSRVEDGGVVWRHVITY